MIRVVLDTNVLVSAAIRPGGKPDQILRQLPGRFELIISEIILAELDTVVTRRHIQTKYKDQVTPDKWSHFIARIRASAAIVEIKTDLRTVVSDRDDEAILATVVDGGASFLVTGDRHLLKIQRYETIRIVSPDDFLRLMTE